MEFVALLTLGLSTLFILVKDSDKSNILKISFLLEIILMGTILYLMLNKEEQMAISLLFILILVKEIRMNSYYKENQNKNRTTLLVYTIYSSISMFLFYFAFSFGKTDITLSSFLKIYLVFILFSFITTYLTLKKPKEI